MTVLQPRGSLLVTVCRWAPHNLLPESVLTDSSICTLSSDNVFELRRPYNFTHLPSCMTIILLGWLQAIELPTFLPDLKQTAQDLPIPNEPVAMEEVLIIDKKAVEKLTEGLLSHYLPDLQNSKLSLQELT